MTTPIQTPEDYFKAPADVQIEYLRSRVVNAQYKIQPNQFRRGMVEGYRPYIGIIPMLGLFPTEIEAIEHGLQILPLIIAELEQSTQTAGVPA